MEPSSLACNDCSSEKKTREEERSCQGSRLGGAADHAVAGHSPQWLLLEVAHDQQSGAHELVQRDMLADAADNGAGLARAVNQEGPKQ